eukprot:13915668-Alexandrium_andersonii.AAC.1
MLSAIEPAQRSALPADQWADVVQLLSVLEREADHSFGAGRPASQSHGSNTGASSPGACGSADVP